LIEAEMTDSKKRILVIDDEDDVCQIIKEKLEPLGYEILTAPDGAEGFRKTVEEHPDCVLLDILIPRGEDGLTYLRNVRFFRHHDLEKQARVRKTPVIVITGAGVKMRPLFEFEGISGFIEKPFDLANLRGKIEHVLQIR
jgi:two-component system, OmpR family, alkaline phosphatase synthesis response regulator PhoP